MHATPIATWRSGTGKVLAVGDIVYTDAGVRGSRSSYRYRVNAIRSLEVDGREVVEVDVWGGDPGRFRLRTFRADVLHRDRKKDSLRPNPR